MSQVISSPRLDNMESAVDRFLASPPYQACLLLVDLRIATLNAAIKHLSTSREWPILWVGAVLAKHLLAVVPRRRPTQAARRFAEAAQAFKPGPVLCRDVDLLFEPSLRLDPLHLLLNTSRQVSLIAAWPGAFDGRALAYAVPEHAHYRVWADPDLCDYCVIAL